MQYLKEKYAGIPELKNNNISNAIFGNIELSILRVGNDIQSNTITNRFTREHNILFRKLRRTQHISRYDNL